jgi:CRISPR-associated protein Cmr4
MYHKAYGIIETLAPLHVGASAGEETGNLNLIFRDQFTQTGIIPGSSIRGRFRADMRGSAAGQENQWYGHESSPGMEDGGTTEALVKFEYASLVWLPVFCPGQPIVWVSCPWLLRRYQKIADVKAPLPKPYTAPATLQGRQTETNGKILFFNLGFLKVEHEQDLEPWIPEGVSIRHDSLVVVDDRDIGMIHDMALYRQSRVRLEDDQKKVAGGAFFNVEALPEGSIMVFPIALKEREWQPFGQDIYQELYFGGLESIGFGRCNVTLSGEFK